MSEIIENFPILKIFQSKITRAVVAVLFIIISLLFLLPFFFSDSSLKFNIAQKISQISGANCVIKGDVSIAILPVPSIIVKDVFLQNYRQKIYHDSGVTFSDKVYNIYVNSMQIELPIFKSSSGPSIEKVILTDAAVESYYSTSLPITRQNKFNNAAERLKDRPETNSNKIDSKFISKLFSISALSAVDFTFANFPDLEVENGEAAFYDNLARKKEIKAINAELEITQKKIHSTGSFSSENINNSFRFLAKFNSKSKKPDSLFEVNSPILNLRISGNFPAENNGILTSDFNGKIEADIMDLKSFYKSYISNSSFFSEKLKYNNKPIKISADIINKTKDLLVQNIVINSNLINGKGEIGLSFVNNRPIIDVDLDLDDLDFDSMWSHEAVMLADDSDKRNLAANYVDETSEIFSSDAEKKAHNNPIILGQIKEEKSRLLPPQNQIEGLQKRSSDNFDLTKKIKDFDLGAEIRISTVKYLNGELRELNTYLTISRNGEILIFPMIFKIPGEGLFRVNGVFDNSTLLPKFIGKLDATGKSLKEVFKWLKIELQNLKFDSLKDYSIYSDIMLLPNSLVLNNSYLNLNGGQSEFLGELKLDESDKTPRLTSRFQANIFNIDDYFLISQQNTYLAPGLLLKKLLWLNEISSNNDLDFRFEKLIYKGEEFSDQKVKLRFGRGYLEIADLNLKSDETNLKANLALDISDRNPKFELDISADNFHYKTPQRTSAPQQRGGLEAPSPIKKYNFFDQFFALPSFEGFAGKMNFNFVNLELDNLKTRNFSLSGNLKNGTLENSKLVCDLYGGRLSYKGLISLKINKIINGNLTFTNVLLQPAFSNTMGIKNIDGVANISASITASASKKEEFISNLNSEIKFNTNSPSIYGYGLSDLVRKMFDPQNNYQELHRPENILINSQSKTVFKQAEGSLQIRDGKEGRLRMNVTAPGISGILSGTVSVQNKTADLLFNVIFITGTRQKQVPINIATSIKGKFDALSQSTNLDQVRQYLGLEILQKPETQDITSDLEKINLSPQSSQLDRKLNESRPQ